MDSAEKVFYQVSLRNDAIREAATQTDRDDELEEPAYLNQQIESIIDHKTEGQRMGVRFHVKWQGYAIKTWERSAAVIAHGGRQHLTKYLLGLMDTSNRKFVYLLKNEPKLASLLKEDNLNKA